MINFDLHIHSFASKYKESKAIVDKSNIENAHVLMSKLEEHKVGLFSITDHNRFWPELYVRFDELISSGDYPEVKGIVAGVEFDVRMDAEMGRCHIITIFDAKNNPENYKKIHDSIENNKLTEDTAAYSRRGFETLLREIGLDVILIACQRSGLDRHTGSHNSLSESTMEPEQLLMTGYINALEFQRPNVEGILRNNLKAIPNNVSLVMGSDCHEWSSYPNHDNKNKNPNFHLSRARILPTFKGLLMAVTSPETRINPQENRNRVYIDSFSIGEKKIPLINGINAIIGENGSGKSTILKLLHQQCKESYVKELIESNRMDCGTVAPSKRHYIGQGDIVSRFENNNLFPEDNYYSVDNSEFIESYTKYSDEVFRYIKAQIKAKESFEQLKKESLTYDELINDEKYFIDFEIDSDFSIVENEHKSRLGRLSKVLKELRAMRCDDYYAEYSSELDQAYDLLLGIYTDVFKRSDQKTIEKNVKNTIVSAAKAYEKRVSAAATSRENDHRDYLKSRTDFIGFIIDAAKKNTEDIHFPEPPKPIQGYSTNPVFGFRFNSEANYHNKDVLNDFLSQMFVKEYASIDTLKRIRTTEELVSAVKGCTVKDSVEEKYKSNLNGFIDQMCECRNYIVDTSVGDESLGNTLGEMSLAYFKYMVEQKSDCCVFLIDQPEDHISNNNISKNLISYFNSIRNKRQIIIVTHNPLLVVNLDVDQVIYISKKDDEIEAVAGCLEKEDDNVNILDIVAQNMDGGKDSIEKRLRVYGKENNNQNVAD